MSAGGPLFRIGERFAERSCSGKIQKRPTVGVVNGMEVPGGIQMKAIFLVGVAGEEWCVFCCVLARRDHAPCWG